MNESSTTSPIRMPIEAFEYAQATSSSDNSSALKIVTGLEAGEQFYCSMQLLDSA
jgi:hypothetical protein